MKKLIALLVAMAMAGTLLAGCVVKKTETAAETDAPTGAKEISSNEITVYTALEDDIIPIYLESFYAKYPDIKVNIVRDSTGIITAKLLAEKDNPQADVVWGTAASSLLVLDQNGMLEAYSPEGVDRVLPEFKDANSPEKWVGIDVWETAFVVNTVEIEKAGVPVPRSYADLIKPEYKGMIVSPDPAATGTGFLTVTALLQLFGEEEGWAYMDKLHENVVVYTPSGSKPSKMAGAGEYPIGISFGYRGIKTMQEGAPVEVVFPAEGAGYDVEANALMKKAEIKKEAKLFLDWAISDPAMAAYKVNYPILSIKSDGTIPEGYTKDPLSQLIKENDLYWAAENREAILEQWAERYSSKAEQPQ